MSRHIIRTAHAALGAGVAVALLISPGPAAGASGHAQPGAPASSAGHSPAKALSPAKYSHRLAAEMNVVRERHGLRKLRVATCMSGFARPWARHMSRTGDL